MCQGNASSVPNMQTFTTCLKLLSGNTLLTVLVQWIKPQYFDCHCYIFGKWVEWGVRNHWKLWLNLSIATRPKMTKLHSDIVVFSNLRRLVGVSKVFQIKFAQGWTLKNWSEHHSEKERRRGRHTHIHKEIYVPGGHGFCWRRNCNLSNPCVGSSSMFTRAWLCSVTGSSSYRK